MRLTLIHPCIGRRIDQPYIRLWQMEPLPPAVIAGLTPRDVEIKFYDDRMERIPFDEPTDVVGMMERDRELRIDYLTSALMRFPAGQATFACAGQLVPYQRMQLFGDRGRIEVEIPFNAPPDKACRLFVDDGSHLADESAVAITVPAADQYTRQADAFSEAIRGVGSVPVSLETALGNMVVIDALVRSAQLGSWQTISG